MPPAAASKKGASVSESLIFDIQKIDTRLEEIAEERKTLLVKKRDTEKRLAEQEDRDRLDALSGVMAPLSPEDAKALVAHLGSLTADQLRALASGTKA